MNGSKNDRQVTIMSYSESCQKTATRVFLCFPQQRTFFALEGAFPLSSALLTSTPVVMNIPRCQDQYCSIPQLCHSLSRPSPQMTSNGSKKEHSPSQGASLTWSHPGEEALHRIESANEKPVLFDVAWEVARFLLSPFSSFLALLPPCSFYTLLTKIELCL